MRGVQAVMGQEDACHATLPALFRRAAAVGGKRIALIDGDESWSWTALDRRCRGFAAQLERLGVGRGDRVALWLPNGVDYVTAILAVAWRGAAAVHVNTRLGAAEVRDLLDRTGARLLVMRTGFAPVDFAGILAAIEPGRLGALETVIAAGFADPPHGLRVVAPTFDGESGDIADPDADCLIYTTGGTTSKPKLVVHRQRSIADHAAAVAIRIGTDRAGAVLLAAVPFCGTFGNIALLAALAGGARVVCMPLFDGTAGDALIREHGVTHLVGDDRMMARLAAAALNGGGSHAGIRFFGVAGFGADARAALAEGMKAGLRPHAIYGSSEVQALFAIGSPEDGGWGAVRPVDPAAGYRVDGEGKQGELLLSGPSVFDRYLDDHVATATAERDGWFRTGDQATAGTDGFVFEGRMGDVLRLGGFLVSPLEIEAFLQQQPGVAGAQVIGVDGPRGPAAFAFAVAEAGVRLDEAGLIGRCRAMLARYKVPVRIVQVDAFPTSTGPNGPKISRAALREAAARMTAQES